MSSKQREVQEVIISIAASTLQSHEAFRLRAKEMAVKLGKDSIPIILNLFHNPPEKPDYLKDNFNRLGSWLSVCQFAEFELLYNFGSESLPAIRKVAFGEYDWTQGNALEVLVRLAADDIEREQIVNELNDKLSNVRYEALYYAAGPLIAQRKDNPRINEVLELIKVSEFWEVIDEIIEENNRE